MMVHLAVLAALTLTGKFTAPDGTVEVRPLDVTQGPENSVVCRVPQSEIAKWKAVSLLVDGAEAKVGEEGFAMMERGNLIHFRPDNGSRAVGPHWLNCHYVAMKTPRKAFIGIVDSLEFEMSACYAVKNGVVRAFPSWSAAGMEGGAYEDIVYTVYELPPTADYNEMAKVYRRHFARRWPDLRPISERVKTQPSLRKLRDSFALRQICARKWTGDPRQSAIGRAAYLKHDFTAADEPKVQCVKTFADTLAGLGKMKAAGMDDVALCLAGWQTGGYDGRCPAVFPVADEPGGEAELRKLIAGAQALGYLIDAHNNFTDTFTCSPSWRDGDVACRHKDGTLCANKDFWDGGQPYDTCLKSIRDEIFRDLRKTRELGFAGCAYIDVFSAAWPYQCFNPKHPATRRETCAIQIEIAKFCRELNGCFASECCFDHMMPYVDYINYAEPVVRRMRSARAKGRSAGFDEVVPFFELAFHDVVLSNPDKVTQEIPVGADRLHLWEFGGRPIVYYWTDADIPAMKALYDEFGKLRHLQGVEMREHRRLGDGIVRVRYANGESLYLNYNPACDKFVEGVRIPAMGWKLVRES